jgi:hypothetical protein
MLETLLSAAGLSLAILASNDTMKDLPWLCSWRRLRLFGHGNQAVVFLTHTLSDRIHNHGSSGNRVGDFRDHSGR